MKLQYISDSNGQTAGVFIPIKDWNELKLKYKGIEQEEMSVPKWHVDVVRERIEGYLANPDQAVDFDRSIDDIETGL